MILLPAALPLLAPASGTRCYPFPTIHHTATPFTKPITLHPNPALHSHSLLVARVQVSAENSTKLLSSILFCFCGDSTRLAFPSLSAEVLLLMLSATALSMEL